MGQLEIPELSEWERRFRDWVIPLLPSGWKGYDNLDEEDVLAAKSILVQEYNRHAKTSPLVILPVLVLVYDSLFPLPPIVYGLVFSAYGSVHLAIPAIQTPESLIGDTINDGNRAQHEVRQAARESVETNVGVIPLVAGFLVQILAVVGTFGNEIIPSAILSGIVPPVLVALSLLLFGPRVLKISWAAIFPW